MKASSRRRRRPQPRPQVPAAVWIVALGALAVLLLVLIVNRPARSTQATGSHRGAATPARSGPQTPAPQPGQTRPGKTRPGKTPGRPAPAIGSDAFEQADVHFESARKLWDEGQRHRRAGETAAYQQSLRDAWKALVQLYDAVRPYTDWFEEADLEGWEMPAAYDVLQGRLDRWDNLRSKVAKLMPKDRE